VAATRDPRAIVLFLATMFALAACSERGRDPAVGAWIVRDSGAPFPWHMYVFNADGTLQQANPDAGDPKTSDSDGKGVWTSDQGDVRGRWVEIIADRATHRYAGRTEISFSFKVNGDSFSGTETARGYDAEDRPAFGPTPPAPFEGRRVALPPAP